MKMGEVGWPKEGENDDGIWTGLYDQKNSCQLLGELNRGYGEELVQPPHFIIYTCFVGSFVRCCTSRSGVAHVVYCMAIVTSRTTFD